MTSHPRILGHPYTITNRRTQSRAEADGHTCQGRNRLAFHRASVYPFDWITRMLGLITEQLAARLTL